MTATTPPRALAPASMGTTAEIARILQHANAHALLPRRTDAAWGGWQRSWALPAFAGLAAAPLAGIAAAALTGAAGVGLLCAALAAGITATGAWLLANAGPNFEAEAHAAETAWTESPVFDELYDA